MKKPNQSLASYIRYNLRDIETKIKDRGFRLHYIVTQLNELGYETTVPALSNYLCRARKAVGFSKVGQLYGKQQR